MKLKKYFRKLKSDGNKDLQNSRGERNSTELMSSGERNLEELSREGYGKPEESIHHGNNDSWTPKTAKYEVKASRLLCKLLFNDNMPASLEAVADLLNRGADPNAIHCTWRSDVLHKYLVGQDDVTRNVPNFIQHDYGYYEGRWAPSLLEDFQTPLLQAIRKHDYPRVELLIEKGANLHIAPTNFSTRLYHFCFIYNNPFFTGATKWQYTVERNLRLLLSTFDVNDRLQSAWLCKGFLQAINDVDELDRAKVLLEYIFHVHHHHPDLWLDFDDWPSGTIDRITNDLQLWDSLCWAKGALHTAVRLNRIDLCKIVLADGVHIAVFDSAGMTALRVAAGNASTEMCLYLLENGASASEQDRSGVSPLVDAVLYGHEAAVRILLAHGADPERGQLSERSRASAMSMSFDSSLLHIAAARGFTAISKLLIEAGATGCHLDIKGSTFWDVAVQKQHWSLCLGLLNRETQSILRENAEKSTRPTVKRIVDRKTELSMRSKTALLILEKAINERQYDAALTLIDLLQSTDNASASTLRNKYEQGVKQAQFTGSIVSILKEAKVEYNESPRPQILCSRCAFAIENLWMVDKLHQGGKLGPLQGDCPVCQLYSDILEAFHTKTAGFNSFLDQDFFLKREESSTAIARSLATRIGLDIHHHPIVKIQDDWHGVLQKMNQSQDDTTGSYAAFEMARHWLTSCVTTHGQCGSQEKHLKPTRVLDISQAKTHNQLRLVTGDTIDKPYAALSHRWGYDEMPRTTLANYSAYQEGISTDKLSLTMRDSILIASSLGLQYLWIDALCIIQDSNNDWLAEAARMEAVFSGAIFTIAVASAEKHSEGIFQKRRARCLRPFHLAIFEKIPYRDRGAYCEGEGELYVFPNSPQVNRDGRPKGPLDRRGWVLQEQILSPRILYYGNGELYWECNTLSASESSPMGISLLNDKNADEAWALRILRKTIGGSIAPAELRDRIADIWKQVILNYSARHLTKRSDKMIALEGILNSLSGILKEKHVAGMWSHDLWSQLLWWSDVTSSHQSEAPHSGFSAPSWSWLNTDGPVFFHSSLPNLNSDQNANFAELQQVASIESFETEIIARDSCITGKLVLTGPCFDYQVTSNDLKNPVWKRWNQKKVRLNTGGWWLDESADLPLDITCIIMAKDELAKALVCLCLVPGVIEDDGTMIYKRIGLCHWEGLEYQVVNYAPSGLEERTVTVV